MPRPTDCICVNLRRAARAMTALYDDALAPAGIKVTQYSLLCAVERNEPAAIGTLSDELDLDRTTLARNLNPLERDGLIELAAGDDRRVTEVRLTRKGRAAVAKATPLWRRAQAEIGGRFAADRLAQLRAIAVEAAAVADGMVAEAGAARERTRRGAGAGPRRTRSAAE
jgi:DNA-binding MarR family transcriptional regulator